MQKDNYTHEDFESDLKNPALLHIKDRDRFKSFYEELGRGSSQKKQQRVEGRSEFIEPNGSIIELGCHVGFNLIHYARQGYFIVGVDVSKTLLKEALNRISKEPYEVQGRIMLVCSFIEELDIPMKFDTVIITETLEHVIDPLPILEKGRDLLSENGVIYTSNPTEHVGNFSHVRGINCEELEALLISAKLKPKEVYSKGIYTFSKSVLI